MSISEAKSKANSRWNAKQDNIMIRPDKATGAAIRAAAAASGQSLTQYILSALAAFGAFDAGADASGAPAPAGNGSTVGGSGDSSGAG